MTTEFKYLDYEGLKLFKSLLEHLRLADKTDIVEVLNEISNGIYNGKLSLYINGVLLNEFTANQEGNTEANIIVPTELGDLNNSVEFIKNVIKYGQPDVSDLTDDQKESLHNQTSEDSGLVSEDSLETTLTSYGTAINYDTEHQKIQLLHNNTVLSEIDASNFIKDSMILDISVADGTGDNLGQKVLLIDFNTDSGINDIEIPISEFFNPNNYYVKDDFAAVATSGNYNDLSNVPSTLTQEEVNLGTNSDGKLVTAKIIRDSIDSAITGGNSKVITDDNLSEKVLAEGFAKSVLVGNNQPTIADVNGVLFVPEQKQTDWSENNTNDKAYIKNKPIVYNLSEIQNIVKYGQADVSGLTDEEKTLIEQENGFVKNSDLPEYEISGSNYVWNFKKNNETVSTITIPEPNEIPTDLSQFNNDVPFLVLSDIENLVESDDVYTKDEINNKIDLISNGSITLSNYYNKTLVNNILNDLPQSDWSLTDNSAKDYIKNKPTLFSGSWNDLTDKPTIPEGSVVDATFDKNSGNAVKNSTITTYIQDTLPNEVKNIVEYGIADITGKTEEELELLKSNSNFALKSDIIQSDWNQSDNTKSDYILNKPTVYSQTEIENIIKYGQSDISGLTPELVEEALNNSEYALKSEIPDISGKANSADLATVATSGSYNDLVDLPENIVTTENISTAISNYFDTPSNKPSYNYSEINYTGSSIISDGGQVSIDGSNNIFKITSSSNISGITLTNIPENYHSCHVIIRNSSSDNDITITISSTATVTIDNVVYSFVCPEEDITLDIAKNSNDYIEFDILRIDNELYIRGI